MKTVELLLAATLVTAMACSSGKSRAPLISDLGNGGSSPDASAGGGANSESGGTGQNAGGTGQNAGGTGQNAGGTGQNAGGTEQNAGGTGQNAGGTGQNAGGTGQNAGGTGTGGAIIGPGSGGADGGALAACTLSSGVEGCDSCVQRHCNAPCVTCQTDSECNAILECILTNCFDQEGVINQQCAGNCETAHPNGKATFDGFIVNPDACARTYCESFCSFF